MSGRPAPPSADASFEDAYRSSGTAVLGYALRRADTREDALDVVAETFATAWRRRAGRWRRGGGDGPPCRSIRTRSGPGCSGSPGGAWRTPPAAPTARPGSVSG